MLTMSRDQELRFTVHESTDYFRLKVSVFNDDKRTDLIGETWVDLKDLIIPGGSQSDHWHPLQSRGKYAGEVRIEMTYYDTRPEDVAVVERRSHAAEKIQAKTSSSTSSSMSAPRQPKDIRRRPLPTDPNAPMHARPPPPEKNPSAPAQLPSARSAYLEQQQQRQIAYPTTHGAGSDHVRHPSRHSIVPAEAQYDASANGPPGPRPMRGYDNPDDFQNYTSPASRPLVPIQQPVPVHPPITYPQAPPSRRYPAEQQYSHHEPLVEKYEAQARTQYGRPRSGYENAPPMDYRAPGQDIYLTRQEQEPPPEPMEKQERNSYYYEPRSRQNSTQDYPFSSSEQYFYNDEPAYGPVAKYPQRASRMMPEQPPADYIHPAQASVMEPQHHHFRHNSVASSHSSLRPTSRDTEYASMQPSVEDEEDEGPPPPPPVHRSGVGHSSQQLVPSPRSSYRAYAPEYATSPRASDDVNLSSQPSHYIPDNVRLQDLPPHTNGSSMPPSLVAGFDPIIADAETDRMYHERRESNRRSTQFEENGMDIQPPVPQPQPSSAPPYPVDPPSRPVDDRGSMNSLVRSRGSASSDSRIIPQRKSISPRPPPVEERPATTSAQIPFSPDSYDALNPNASRSAVTSEPARQHDTPSQAMEAARRGESQATRDPTPIIGDDGREIDPSDHLPSDTWAPEPEKKNRKPELVVRFKNPPVQSSPVSQSSREARPIRVTFKPQTETKGMLPSPEKNWERPTSSHSMQQSSGALERTSPGMEMTRGREVFRHYGGGRNYSRSPAMDSPHSSRRPSISPSPGSISMSSLYEPVNPGPPIPAKVPIAQPMNQSYPMIANTSFNNPGAPDNTGIDALSRELNTIDIGSVGCNTNRALRKYVPRVTTGYAS